MVLSIRSGIEKEIHWALDRLLRISSGGGENVPLKSYPGLIDALFEWPDWYAVEGHELYTDTTMMFAVPHELQQKRRNAIVSLLVIRNCTWQDQNVNDLAYHPRTLPFILNALYNVNPSVDENSEFILHTIDFLYAICGRLRLPSVGTSRNNPLEPLLRIASTSNNRPTIISALTTITGLLSLPENAPHLSPNSAALDTAIRYLPLFVDSALVDACLNYLHVHLSNASMLKAFLLHRDMPAVLRVLVSLLINDQVEEKVIKDISPFINTMPVDEAPYKLHELTPEERESLLPMPEPERCYEW